MDFRISGLEPALFSDLFGMNDAELATRNAVRKVVDSMPGYPCRISLDDAQPGETVLLVNYRHQAAETPFQASHGIYVREAVARFDAVNTLPPALLRRVLSVRGFDAAGWLLDADLVDGKALAPLVETLFANPDIDYLHVHYAKPGCFAARVDRLRHS